MKRKMTRQQEFEIMKLVLDKFLWLGLAVMVFGIYKMAEQGSIDGLYYLIAGIIILVLFLVMIVKEYEITRKNK